MNKKYLNIALISLTFTSFAQNTKVADVQTTANNIATQLQIPPSERSKFNSEFTNKSLEMQNIMEQNISAQEKADKAKALLTQTNQNLRQTTSANQLTKYNSYFNKNATLTASVNNTKLATNQNNSVQSSSVQNNTNQNDAVVFTKGTEYNILPSEHQKVMDNMAIQLSLNNEQFQKMSKEYLLLIVGIEDINKKHAKDPAKAKVAYDAQVAKTNSAVKTFLTTPQYNQFVALLKAGKLGKDKTPRVAANTNSVNKPTTTNTTNSTSTFNNNRNLSEISSAKTLTELRKPLTLTDDQYTKALVVANKYDAEIKAICAKFPNNITQQKTELDKKTPTYVAQFKTALNPTQANTYFGVLVTQANILTGKNLTPDQQQLINTLKTKYGMSDVQIIQSMLIISEAKIKADANNNLNKNNPTVLKQESDKIIADVDAKFKEVLSTDQYNKVKADIVNAINKK